MIFAPLLVFVTIFIFASRRYRLVLREIDLVANTITTATEALLVNDLPKINTSPANASPHCHAISETLKKYLYLGILQADNLRILQQAVTVARRYQEQVWQMRLLFMTRSGAVLIFTMLGNFFLASFITVSPPSYTLTVAISGLILAGFLLLEKTIPVSWFWHKGVTEIGQKWITSLLDHGDYNFHPGITENATKRDDTGDRFKSGKNIFLDQLAYPKGVRGRNTPQETSRFFPSA